MMTVEVDNISVLEARIQRLARLEGRGSEPPRGASSTMDVQFTSLADGAEGVEFTQSSEGKEDFLSYLDGLTARLGDDLLSR